MAGPYPVLSLGGMSYVLTLLCEHSSYCDVAILKCKSDAPAALQRMITAWEVHTGQKCKFLFTDRGGEYVGSVLASWCASKGIVHEFSVPRTPEQNGKAERLNQTLNNIMRSLLFQYDTYAPLWGHAMVYAARIYNVTMCARLGMTRYEAFLGEVPDVSNYRTFGCKVYARVHDTLRNKLDPKSQVGIFLGPEVNGPGYKVLVYDPNLKRANKYAVHVVRDMFTFETLTAVTGAQETSDLYWRGSIPLPRPRSVAAAPEPLEALTGVPQPPVQPLHLALPHVEAPALRAAIGPVIAEDEASDPRREALPAPTAPVTRSMARKRTAVTPAVLALPPPPGVQAPGPSKPPPVRVISPAPLTVGAGSGIRPNGPYVERPRIRFMDPVMTLPSGGPISRMAPALLAVGAKRPRDSNDDEDVDGPLIAATAFSASPPFPLPPADAPMSRDEIVDGLLRYFKVPESEGLLPVITDADPSNVPKTLKKAMETKFAKFWAEAAVDEWLSIVRNNTWLLVDHEPWMKVIPCKWVFTIKTDSSGAPQRFKARLVAGGHRQVEGIDYAETYAPVSRLATLRAMFSIAAHRGWKVHQLDITTAFLHGQIDADVYMMQPPGFVDGQRKVCKLTKCLYGLKQAPRAWYNKLKEVLGSLGFAPVSADSSFWVRDGDSVLVYLSSVVDDMLVTSADEKLTLRIVSEILEKLPGKHMGIAEHFNGMKVNWRTDGSVVLTQPAHVDKLVQLFSEMGPIPLRKLPVKGKLRFCMGGTSDDPCSPPLDVERYHYRALMGGLNYISCCTRPDITFVVNQLSRYLNAPTVAHWQTAIGVLGYLSHTISWGIRLGAFGSVDAIHVAARELPKAHAFADANHGTGMDDKKSVTGVLLAVYGGPVSWASKVQPVTSVSTAESEYRALSEATREALWLQKIVRLFDVPCRPFCILGDSASAIHAIKNHAYTKHTRHIEIHHDFMKDRLQNGDVAYHHVPGVSNPADIFTKALPEHDFVKCREALGMVSVASGL
jgi:Reverse transcriptase (RNA-dependent DNA polymerase)